jgi:di/tricarboxylate transporter
MLPALFVLAITLIAATLLITERLRPDLVALLVLVVLGLSGLVTPPETFAGFSGSAVMTILAVSIISEGLHATGVTHWMGQWIRRIAGQNEVHLILVIMLASAGLSLLMNNIAAVGVLLPAVMTLARQTEQSPSKLMMPLAFGTLLGGMATLLTTSNIIVSGALKDAGYTPFGLLDFLPIGIPVILVGVIYMLIWGRRFLTSRPSGLDEMRIPHLGANLAKMYDLEKNICYILVLPGSFVAGQSLQAGGWYQRFNLSVVGLIHLGNLRVAPGRDELVYEGDIVISQGNPDPDILRNFGLRLEKPTLPFKVVDESVVLAELVLSPHTKQAGSSLREIHFREKYGFNVLAIWRDGEALKEDISDLPLRFGDALLVQGPAMRLRMLREERDFIVLEEDPDPVLNPRRTRVAIVITLLTLAIASTGWLPVAQVVFAGALLMLLTGCLGMDDAYHSIEWKAIFVIAGMWPLSTAIQTSGLADIAVGAITRVFANVSSLGLAGILLILTLGITQLVGGQVASLILSPLALSAAVASGADARGMGMAVALGCSLAFLTPYGHPVNVMVMGPGGYTMRDFLRIGGPLTVLLVVTILTGLHFFWGL